MPDKTCDDDDDDDVYRSKIIPSTLYCLLCFIHFRLILMLLTMLLVKIAFSILNFIDVKVKDHVDDVNDESYFKPTRLFIFLLY
jgi:hypothetical protein